MSVGAPREQEARAGTAMIRLERLTKRFHGEQQPAVDELTLEVPEGEIVILVGPSGCGKTTTMKLINRIIEPTSGRIILDGEDVTTANPAQLRRRIGYVIQQIGLFPHMTIAENIATVPKLLGWSSTRVEARVDEMLETVNMDPAVYKHRYPKQLSGGQRQRVGVARALSADPAVMLMDEPFGAIDPITRDRLQNEFLRLQSEVRKTIVFVTHDIDEAIKMGDRIAILRDGSRVAQYDTPEQILTAPANDYVADFIGRGASLKRLNLSHVGDIRIDGWDTVDASASASEALRLLQHSERRALLVLGEQRRPLRWVAAGDLQNRNGTELRDLGSRPEAVVSTADTLHDALNELITSQHTAAVVVGDDGAFRGVVDVERISEAIRSMRSEAATKARAESEPAAREGER